MAPTRRSEPRCHQSLPPLLAEGEPFEGAAVLAERGDGTGLVLWRTLRDLNAWIDTPPADRGRIFRPAAAAEREAEIAVAGVPSELWVPLLAASRLLATPTSVDEARLLHACRGVARWAERDGAPATRLAFTQTAARLAPNHPPLSYAVGRLARDQGEFARAETWLRHAVRLARRRDWATYVLAYLGLGKLYQLLGNLPAARALALRGTRTARRRRLRRLEGTGHHDLMVLAVEAGRYAEAQDRASVALECYGPGHARLPALAYDLASVWFLCGHVDRALPVFEAVLPHITVPRERAVALANVARAAAGAGDPARYDSACGEAAEVLAALPASAQAAEAWLNLGRAAVTRSDAERARLCGARALEIASTLRLGQLALEAEAVLGSSRSARPSPVEPVEGAAPAIEVRAPLAERFVSSLREARVVA
jgi:tetratricopeptide (TPR) repeat protein